MEFLAKRQPFAPLREEKHQMLELNQRLESYLGRVKLLEEENKLLREEIDSLKSSRGPPGQRKAQEEALSQAREMLAEAWRKKDQMGLEVENLMEDIEVVNLRREKEKDTNARTQRKLLESKKELEEERRAQIWLREKAAQLEKDLLLEMQIHQNDMETLQASLKQSKQVLLVPRLVTRTDPSSVQDLRQEYSHRVTQVWQETTSLYRRQTEHLEKSLSQVKGNVEKIQQKKRENQHQVKELGRELESTKSKREMLERRVKQQREEQMREFQHLQEEVDALEVEKENIGQHIDSLMVERQNLQMVKMSLGLEVATYRALLDGEGLRISTQTTNKSHSSFPPDALSKPRGDDSTTSCHFSRPVSTSHRSIASSQTLLTRVAPASRERPVGTSRKSSQTAKKIEPNNSEEIKKTANQSEDGEMVCSFPQESSSCSVRIKQQSKPADAVSEVKPQQFPSAQVNEAKLDESAATCESSEQTSVSQAPDIPESSEGKDEDTVSAELARISHAPTVICEESKTPADDDASEKFVELELTRESLLDLEKDSNEMTLSHINSNNNLLTSAFPEQRSCSLRGFVCEEESLEVFRSEEQENLRNVGNSKTESVKSEAEAEFLQETKLNETIKTDLESKVEEQCELHIDGDLQAEAEEIIWIERENDEIVSEQDGGENVALVIESCQSLIRDHDEEENKRDGADSPNRSASLLTDPGECDSYTQENTLADTRPLIHYKSDEETERNTKASRLEVDECGGSEDEKERVEGGQWSQPASRRFNTMEDLSEEPDMDVIGEMMTQDVLREEALGEVVKIHESLKLDVKEGGSARFEISSLEKEDEGDVMDGEEQDLLVSELKLNQQLSKEQKIHCEQATDSVRSNESEEIHPGMYHEETHKSSYEASSTLTMFQEETTFEPPFEEVNVLDCSLYTNMDLTDNQSLETEINSQPDESVHSSSEEEESHTPEDQSPNASQMLQNAELNSGASYDGEDRKYEVSDVENSDDPGDDFSKARTHEDPLPAMIDGWHHFTIDSKNTSTAAEVEITRCTESAVASTYDCDPDKMFVKENIDDHVKKELESTMDGMCEEEPEIANFKSCEKERFLSKESEIDGLFSAGPENRNSFWNEGHVELTATCDSTKTAEFSAVGLNPGTVFGDEWRDENREPVMVHPEEEVKILRGQNNEGKTILSDDSADGESWSSGDE